MSTDSLKDTIVPNSDQLNADDLIGGPVTVTITSVRRGQSAEQPVVVGLSGYRPYLPCKSMRRVLILAWGDKGKDWVGRSMTLYRDETVRFGGVAVGGIRISHLSDIGTRLTMMLTTSRSKRVPYTVDPLATMAMPGIYPEGEFERNLPAWRKAISEGKITPEQLAEKAAARGMLSDEQIARILK